MARPIKATPNKVMVKINETDRGALNKIAYDMTSRLKRDVTQAELVSVALRHKWPNYFSGEAS